MKTNAKTKMEHFFLLAATLAGLSACAGTVGSPEIRPPERFSVASMDLKKFEANMVRELRVAGMDASWTVDLFPEKETAGREGVFDPRHKIIRGRKAERKTGDACADAFLEKYGDLQRAFVAGHEGAHGLMYFQNQQEQQRRKAAGLPRETRAEEAYRLAWREALVFQEEVVADGASYLYLLQGAEDPARVRAFAEGWTALRRARPQDAVHRTDAYLHLFLDVQRTPAPLSMTDAVREAKAKIEADPSAPHLFESLRTHGWNVRKGSSTPTAEETQARKKLCTLAGKL